jgi:hypothetical protein
MINNFSKENRMSEISTNTVFVALIIAVVLLFIGTLCSAITAALMFGFNNWLKVSTKDVKSLEHRASDMDINLEKIKRSLKRLDTVQGEYLMMMHDASNMELSPEEISSRIRDRLDRSGFKVITK